MPVLSTDEPSRIGYIDIIEAPVSLWDGLRGLSMALDLTMGRYGQPRAGGRRAQSPRGATLRACGRLLAAAAAFDAMIGDRSYRTGIAPEEALRRVREGRGTQFDPDAAELLEAVVNTRGVETKG